MEDGGGESGLADLDGIVEEPFDTTPGRCRRFYEIEPEAEHMMKEVYELCGKKILARQGWAYRIHSISEGIRNLYKKLRRL